VPELPEVETVRRVLQDVLPSSLIRCVELHRQDMLEGISPDRFCSQLKGRRVLGVDRRGKFLLIRLDHGTMMVHLGMTGQIFLCYDRTCVPSLASHLPDRHTHLILKLSCGAELYFRDSHRFGRYGLLRREEETRLSARLGPEPLGSRFTARRLTEILSGRRASIKALLMDQRVVAGMGNIYTDESLFRAGIDPRTPAGRLSTERVAKLHRSLRRVLREGIYHGGTTLSDYLDPRHTRGSFQLQLRVYGRAGEPCVRCRAPIRKGRVAQRGTHWCPRCQPWV